MSVVVSLGAYKSKETLAMMRELLVKASRGQVAHFIFEVEFTDGTRKVGRTGKYRPPLTDAAKRSGKP